MAKEPDRYLTGDPWRLIEDGFHPDRSRVSESLFALGNEHQGVRGFFDEGTSGSTLIGCYLNTIYEERHLKEPMQYKGIENRLRFMVNTVNWLYTRLEIDGETLDLNSSAFTDFRRVLDFRTGELQREFVWQTASGKRINVAFSRFLSMATKEIGYQRIALTPLNFSGAITVTMGLDFAVPHEMYGENYWTCPRKEHSPDGGAILGVSKNIGHKLFAGFAMQGAMSALEPLTDEKFAGQRFTVNLSEGVESVIDKRSVIYTTRDPQQAADQCWAEGVALMQSTANVTYDGALAENERYWADFWEKTDIVIEGDPLTQQGIRFCIFQLQQTYRGVVEGANIGAKGLTGEVYNGNAFWDTEAYCLPYYLFSNPDAAKALLEFRYKTLDQALERAARLDCEGACYPIATIDGTESCTLWQHASLQFQPTTAVAYGIDHYTRITQDTGFLYGDGAEMLIPICRFLASRGQWSPRTGKFGYYAVMGPDEFQMMVNNNAYTNYMAQRTFRFAAGVFTAMPTDQRAALFAKVGCTPDEVAHWQHLADSMHIPRDAETGVYEQHEGFFDLPHIDVDAIPVEEFPLYHNWSYDRIYRNDMIKQPDVLMFMLLYNQSFSLAEKQANYTYYEPRCIHESSLSPSVHSILAAELGRAQEAADFFEFATRIDLDNYNRNTGEGIHITSLAAAWMNIVYGFGGMRSDGETLLFNPTIPAHWNAYSFQILYRGSRLRISVTQDEARIVVIDGGAVMLSVRGEPCEVTADGISIRIKGQAAPLSVG
jgi:maltose phosphorylase